MGAGWTDKTISVPSIVPGESVTGHTFGALGGGQIGCNVQFGGWVIGIEGEGSAADIRGDTTQTIQGVTGTAHAETDWLASATGRLGWASGGWMIYGKGGAAWAHDKYSLFIPVFPEQETARGGDPVLDGLTRAYGAAFAAYARDELGFKTEMTYVLLSGEISGKWDWGEGSGRATASVSEDIRNLLALARPEPSQSHLPEMSPASST